MPFYAVAKGRSQGVYNSWGDCENQVKGFSGASFKKFDTLESANAFVNSGGSTSAPKANQNYGYNSNYSSSSSYNDYGTSFGYATSSFNQNKGAGSRSNFVKDNHGYVQVYTDGACSDNGHQGARAGLGVYWGEGHHLNTSEPVSGRATNNSGEIQAANRAIKQAIDNGITKLTINTDSKFLIDSVTKWMPDWKENGWKRQSGEPVKNEADFKELDNLQKKVDVKWNHIDAHSGVRGNERADQLAKEGASKYN